MSFQFARIYLTPKIQSQKTDSHQDRPSWHITSLRIKILKKIDGGSKKSQVTQKRSGMNLLNMNLLNLNFNSYKEDKKEAGTLPSKFWRKIYSQPRILSMKYQHKDIYRNTRFQSTKRKDQVNWLMITNQTGLQTSWYLLNSRTALCKEARHWSWPTCASSSWPDKDRDALRVRV